MSLTIIEALKKKGSKGGNNIMEAIDNLPKSEGGGGGGTIGGGTVYVTFTKNGTTYSADKTAAEIISLVQGGSNVIGVFDDSANGYPVKLYTLVYFRPNANSVEFEHITYSYDFGLELVTMSLESFTINANGVYHDKRTW